MKYILFCLFIGFFTAALFLKDTSLFVLSFLFLTFTLLEVFQTHKEKHLNDWYKEVKETKPNDIEDWHKMDYEKSEINNN